MQYGTVYSLIDFVNRMVPVAKLADGPFIKEVIDGLKKISIVQNKNPWVTMTATKTGGIWIFYRNRRRWLINPTQHYLRVENKLGEPTGDPDIEPFLRTAIKKGYICETNNVNHKQWLVKMDGLPYLWKFIEGLKKPPSNTDLAIADQHPRSFPGEVRQAALQAFERSGRICPGVDKKTKQHKLRENDRIEFDHILPHARRGASTYSNIQVLCVACNRLKRNTAM